MIYALYDHVKQVFSSSFSVVAIPFRLFKRKLLSLKRIFACSCARNKKGIKRILDNDE